MAVMTYLRPSRLSVEKPEITVRIVSISDARLGGAPAKWPLVDAGAAAGLELLCLKWT